MLATAVLWVALAADAGAWKLAATKGGPGDPIPAEAAKKFRAEGVRVLDASGEAVATVWWAKELVSDALPEQAANGLTYREFKAGTVLAIVRFPNAFTDSRRQSIAAGTYTLRLGFQPETGDHKGTAPNTEFGVLSRWEDDAKLEAIDMKELVERSTKAVGTHPAVMLLFPNYKPGDAAKLAAKGGGWLALEDKLPVAGKGAKPLGISLVVRGSSEKSPQ